MRTLQVFGSVAIMAVGCGVSPTEPNTAAPVVAVVPAPTVVPEPTLPPVVNRTPPPTPTKTPVPFVTPSNCGPGGLGYSDEPPFGCIAYCPCNYTPTPTPVATPTPTPTPCNPFSPC